MSEPCRSCEARADDFGGCRCQALAISGDASAADPVCELSPDRVRVDALIENSLEPGTDAYTYRRESGA